MAWERRQRGARYYYRCVRLHGRPRKVYVGTGPAAEEQAQKDAENRRRRQADREAAQQEAERLAANDPAFNDYLAGVNLLVRAALLAAGYHEHRGCWRRRRSHS